MAQTMGTPDLIPSDSAIHIPPTMTAPINTLDKISGVYGLEVTSKTQCTHWHSDRDIIAIKHKCCGRYYACISCHAAIAGHVNQVWPKDEQDNTKAVLCGNCYLELAITEYLGCGNTCPSCQAAFNPGCRNHYHLYFER